MGYLSEVDLGPSFQPFAVFRKHYGFVPNLFRAQTLLPRVIDAEAALVEAIVSKPQALSRVQKECILLTLAAVNRNAYCIALNCQMMTLLGVPEEKVDQIVVDYRQAQLSPANTALMDFVVKLGGSVPAISREDFTAPFAHGFTHEGMLETILVTGLASFLCTLSTGLGAVPDFTPRPIPPAPPSLSRDTNRSPATSEEGSEPYLRAVERSPDDFAPFAFFRDRFGFVAKIFRAQTLRPDVLEAEAGMLRAVLLSEDLLTRLQKEYILLVVSAANLNTYWVAVISEILRALGVPPDKSEQIAINHREADLRKPDETLLDFALKLATRPCEFRGEDMEPLRHQAFSECQILEAVVMTALTNFFNTLQIGLGTSPDFVPRRTFQAAEPKKAHLSAGDYRHTNETSQSDPDAEFVARVQGGDLNAFEELVNRHGKRVYRTLVGILGDPDEARDAMQDTFLKAFQHIGGFERRSKFSTWLVSIASNTGLQRLRDRKSLESLDDSGFESEEDFRPRQVQAWGDNPEQLYSQREMRELVENGVMKLPTIYRVVLVLRDIEQLSTEDAAAALGLGIPALKARLLRGRLMLREALAPHFTKSTKGVAFD